MLSALLLLAAPFVSAGIVARHDAHHDVSPGQLPTTWYHTDEHPVHKLFKRGPATDGINYAAVGSPTWASAYPRSSPDISQLPQAWTNALSQAVQAGKIPDIPKTTNTPQTNPSYPSGTNPMDPSVCSSTYKCRIPGDTWDAPNGVFGTGFDDGPQPASATLNKFLKANNERATHYMIGVNILNNAGLFTEAFEELENDIAVHTWTHPYMTTLTNEEIVGQLGWTMEIIHNSTGGRLPRYWRPPYGDYDQRVRAVAREVFGLEVILWNQDTEDWSLTTGGTSMGAVNASMHRWLTGPKSPGLIILEHELSDQSVQAFISAYPEIKANGWRTLSQAEIPGGSVYQNEDDDGNVTPNLVGAQVSIAPSSSSSTSSSSASTTGSSGSSTTSTSGSTSASSSTTSTTATGSPTSAAANNGAPSDIVHSLTTILVAIIPALFVLV
ncbi:hypothetical protein PC9H_005387 [Pleurotus ostreatus]|uniref:chitin deacetylase n=1 Tax=Pleurotus ostreatus TaxID=5322 RepID=A0A8H7DVG9_PLEOS|nr:uncharacterized protein PC9H_005387 [Pleurotus ostreatus]KAF7433435.1 hypothetical protein PC9H_005387 [Pleurotus ostreatus]